MLRAFFGWLVVLCGVSLVIAADTDPVAGVYRDDKMTISIAPNGSNYIGTISMGEKVFPFTATGKDGNLSGKFTNGGNSFAFTATIAGDSVTFKTGTTEYVLTREPGDKGKPGDMPDKNAGNTPGGVNPPGPIVVAPPVANNGPARSEQVEAAIKKAKAYLYAQQKNGSWDLPARAKEPVPNAKGEVNVMDIQNSSQWGGLSALATYALLAGGENPTDPRMASAIEFLKKADFNGTYALGVRAQVWNMMPNNKKKEYLEFAKRDRDLLMKNKRINDQYRGMFRYLPTDQGYDHSASQFAVLGMWACTSMGVEVPSEFWKDVEDTWIKNQDGTGGWNYGTLFSPRQPVTPSMTAAGVATLFITLDMLHNDVGLECKGNISHKEIDAGLKWISSHFDSVSDNRNQWPFYSLYGIERIGLASGYKYLGTNDWYKLGTERLIGLQQGDGSWGESVSDTCFGLLFLVRGRNPVVMNKLEYAIDQHGDKAKEANWNQRPRDCANVTKWISKQLERELNWQIVNLRGPVEDLHDAPILLISGNQSLAFTSAEEDKLRTFVQQGGMILGHADCSNPVFATAFKKLGSKLFQPYEFRELPANHAIYSNLFDRKKWKTPMNVQGLSNGARELMMLIPAGDPARFWQNAAFGGHEAAYEVMANIFMYVSERKDLRYKGDSWVVSPDKNVTASSQVKIARLEFAGNWNPEPGGWSRLGAIMHNEARVDLATESVKLGEGKLAGYKVAHLTSGGKFKLSEKERAELKAWIEGGGTLITDATGGNGEAQASLETEIAALVPGKMTILPTDHKAYANLGIKPEEITFRAFAARQQVGQAKGPRVRGVEAGGRVAVLYSPEDLGVGMVGQPIDGIAGYTPASATALMQSLIVFAANQ